MVKYRKQSENGRHTSTFDALNGVVTSFPTGNVILTATVRGTGHLYTDISCTLARKKNEAVCAPAGARYSVALLAVLLVGYLVSRCTSPDSTRLEFGDQRNVLFFLRRRGYTHAWQAETSPSVTDRRRNHNRIG